METWFSIDRIGSFASIVGFVLTIYVTYSVSKIKQEFLFRARLPGLLKKLQGHASAVSRELPNLPESTNSIIEELAIAQVNIQSLESKSSGTIKTSLKKLRLRIAGVRNSSNIEKEVFRAIYLEMNMAIQEIQNIQEDDKWRHGNG